jgi:hypothetical protein
MAVKIARSGGGFTAELAREAEQHLEMAVQAVARLPHGFVSRYLTNVAIPELEEQVRARAPVAGEYRVFQGRVVPRSEAELVSQ